MGTRAVLALASDSSGDNFYNTVIELEYDGFRSNLEYLAKEALNIAKSINNFDIKNSNHITQVRNKMALVHSGWLFLTDISNVSNADCSAVLNLETQELEVFGGFFDDSEVVVKVSSQIISEELYIYITKSCAKSISGKTIERHLVSALSASDLDILTSSLLKDEAVIEISITKQSDAIETGFIGELLQERYEKEVSQKILFQ